MERIDMLELIAIIRVHLFSAAERELLTDANVTKIKSKSANNDNDTIFIDDDDAIFLDDDDDINLIHYLNIESSIIQRPPVPYFEGVLQQYTDTDDQIVYVLQSGFFNIYVEDSNPDVVIGKALDVVDQTLKNYRQICKSKEEYIDRLLVHRSPSSLITSVHQIETEEELESLLQDWEHVKRHLANESWREDDA